MSEKPGALPVENAVGNVAAGGGAPPPPSPKKPVPEGNPAFRMMGLPRLRLPSRNWMIFLSITGSFAGAVIYDKWQTKRIREKWCNLVSHIADEQLDTKTLPRRLTIYLGAPPADGLRGAREHFHDYIKPILVAAAMDWDAVEGRKEGDIRHKTSERIRKKRRRAGEGTPEDVTEEEKQLTVEAMRERNGTKEYEGVAGDIVVGRNTWKEYVRGLHEGWLGPADAPPEPEPELETARAPEVSSDQPGHSSLGDAAVKGAANVIEANTKTTQSQDDDQSPQAPSEEQEAQSEEQKEEEKKKAEEEKPKPRFPPSYILPESYPTAPLSPTCPSILGPIAAIPYPHLLGIRNTPIRIYRFLTRRHLADSIGREVAAAVLASQHRPFYSGEEVSEVLEHEEKNWWKTVYQPRKEHEESIWLEDVVKDERIVSRMRRFELAAEDESRVGRVEKEGE